MFLPLLFILPSLFYSLKIVYQTSNQTSNQTKVEFSQVQGKLTVTDAQLKYEEPVDKEEGTVHYHRRYVWIYSTLKNDSDYRWENFEFLVEFFDTDGKRLDVINTSTNITIQPHSELELRLSCDMAIDPKDVAKTKIIVTDARQPYR